MTKTLLSPNDFYYDFINIEAALEAIRKMNIWNETKEIQLHKVIHDNKNPNYNFIFFIHKCIAEIRSQRTMKMIPLAA